MTNESDFAILGHVIADHYRAVVKLQEENAALQAENVQLRQVLADENDRKTQAAPTTS